MEKTKIKKSDMKLYDTFYNTNGHLSIVYAITHNYNYHILNYNHANIYYLTTGLFEYDAAFVTPEDFFQNFPINSITCDQKRKQYLEIEREFYQRKTNYHLYENSRISYKQNKLLLIL